LEVEKLFGTPILVKLAVAVLALKVEQGKSGAQIGSHHHHSTTAHALLANALGTTDADFMNAILTQLASATGKGSAASEENLNFVLSVMARISPRDRVEATLAAQMAVVHLATMTFTRGLPHVDNIPQQDSAQNALNKLMRTFTNQMETLKRYRSVAQQTVKVEHVHVHQGGQAIVGNVQTGVARQNLRIKPMNKPLPMHQSKRCGAPSRRSGSHAGTEP
jgi:hypothetical protein